MAGILPLALVLSIAAQPAAQPAGIVAHQRSPFALLLITPQGEVGKLRSSEIISYFSDRLRQHTNFEIQVVDASVGRDCPGEVGCMVRRVRTDYNRLTLELPDGTVDSYDSHLERLQHEGTLYPKYLLVLSNFVAEGQPDRLLAYLVDTDKALRIFHEASREDPSWQDEAEDAIAEKAIVKRPKRVELSDKKATEDYLEKLFMTDVRDQLEKSGDWEPFGTIEIQSDVPGVAVHLDGQAIGTTSAGTTRIIDVPNGPHKIELAHPDFETFASQVEVPRRGLVTVNAELRKSSTSSAPELRQGLFWGGVGTAALGVGLTAAALVASGSGPHEKVVCLGGGCDPPDTWVRLGGSDGAFLNPQQSGILFAPLGYSLIGAGGAWALGTELFGEEDDMPWVQLAAGVVLGVASYGLSAALE